MEWFTLFVWVVVALVALPLGAGAGTVPAFLVPGLAAVGGVVLTVLWIVLDAADWTAWVAIGVSAMGVATVGSGAYVLMSEYRSSSSGSDEVVAMLAGVALPFFAVAGSMSLLLATIA